MPFSYAPSAGQRNVAGELLSGATDAAGNPIFGPPRGQMGQLGVATGPSYGGPPPGAPGPRTMGAASSLPGMTGGGSQMPRMPQAPAMPTYGGPLPVMPSAQAPGSGPSQQSVEQAALAGGGDASRTQDFISALRAVGAGQNNAQMNAGTPAPAPAAQLMGAPVGWTGSAGTTSMAQTPGGAPVGSAVAGAMGPPPPVGATPGFSPGGNGTPQLPGNFGQPAPGDAWEKQSAAMPSPFGGGMQSATMMRPIGGGSVLPPRPSFQASQQPQGAPAASAPMQRPQQAPGMNAPPQRPPQQGQPAAPSAQPRPAGAAGLMAPQRPPPLPHPQAMGSANIGGAMMSDETAKQAFRPAAGQVRSLLEEIGEPRSYEYKDPKHGAGRYVSPMAQDLERHPLGRDAVIETPEGKMVDYGRVGGGPGRLPGVLLASDAMLNARINELEQRLARKGRR